MHLLCCICLIGKLKGNVESEKANVSNAVEEPIDHIKIVVILLVRKKIMEDME